MIIWGPLIHIYIASAFALLYRVEDKIIVLDLTFLINRSCKQQLLMAIFYILVSL